jgi:hypothetical protein
LGELAILALCQPQGTNGQGRVKGWEEKIRSLEEKIKLATYIVLHWLYEEGEGEAR